MGDEFPSCRNHHERAAVCLCVLCNSPLCQECTTLTGGVNLCSRCLIRRYHGMDPPGSGEEEGRDGFWFLLLGVTLSVLFLLFSSITFTFLLASTSSRNLDELNRRKLELVKFGIEDFQRDTGRYPDNEEGLDALFTPSPVPGRGAIEGWKGPYLAGEGPGSPRGRVNDAYRREIIYRNWGDGSFVYIGSSGKNRRWDSPLLMHSSFTGDVTEDDMVLFLENPFPEGL